MNKIYTSLIDVDFSKDATWNVLVNPEMARELIKLNRIDNRRLRGNIVSKYAHDMVNGNWGEFGSDCIVFDTNKKIMSGQHRICAVAESGKTIGFKFMTGQPPESFRYIDGAHPRRVSDFIFEKNAKTRETATIAMCKMDEGITFRTVVAGGKGQATRQDALNYYETNKETVGCIATKTVQMRNSLLCGQTRGYIVFGYCILKLFGEDRLEEFVEALVNPTSAFMFKFRENLLRRYSKKDAKPEAAWLLGMLFQAFEMYERAPEKFSMNKGDAKVSHYEDKFKKLAKEIS